MQGRFFWEKRTEEGFKKALDFFEQAIAKDPSYALAYVGLADTYGTLIGYGFIPAEETIPKIKALLKKALDIDGELAEADVLLALITYNYDWDWEGAGKRFELALQLNPNYVYAHLWYGIYLANKGQIDKAMERLKRAYELDPLNIVANYGFGPMNVLARREGSAF